MSFHNRRKRDDNGGQNRHPQRRVSSQNSSPSTNNFQNHGRFGRRPQGSPTTPTNPQFTPRRPPASSPHSRFAPSPRFRSGADQLASPSDDTRSVTSRMTVQSEPILSNHKPGPVRLLHRFFLDDDALGALMHPAPVNAGGGHVIVEALLKPDRIRPVLTELINLISFGQVSPEQGASVISKLHEAVRRLGCGESLNLSVILLDVVSVAVECGVAQPAVTRFLSLCDIPFAIMRAHLDFDVLNSLGLVRPTFERNRIRFSTTALYKPKAYNLLREDSEGYTKLLTEYFSSVSAQSMSTDTVRRTVRRVTALIGTFDLDVSRVLDLTLDVFANLLIKHYRFFVRFVRMSPWWFSPMASCASSLIPIVPTCASFPSWSDPQSPSGDSQLVPSGTVQGNAEFWNRVSSQGIAAFFFNGESSIASTESIEEATRRLSKMDPSSRFYPYLSWIATTGALPVDRNSVAAQFLGFKFLFYSRPGRPSHPLPDNLVWLAALLVKIGFISLMDLYPYLSPDDEAMAALKLSLIKERRESLMRAKPGSMNALASAAALSLETSTNTNMRDGDGNQARGLTTGDADGAPNSNVAPEAPIKPDDKANQKLALLKGLLCIGALPESLFLLGKYPWLIDLHPDLPAYFNRILRFCISPLASQTRPLQGRNGLRTPKSICRHPLDGFSPSPRPARRTLRWYEIEKSETGIDYQFYWSEWADQLPLCHSVDQFFLLSDTLIKLVGYKIGLDPVLVCNIIRIGVRSLSDDPSSLNHKRWEQLTQSVLLPCLSFSNNNIGMVNQIFDLLTCFPTASRYRMYAEWFTGPSSRRKDLADAFSIVRAHTTYTLKRVSTTNIAKMSSVLSRISLSSPGILFNLVWQQIESYDNLIDVIVDCAQSFTPLGYDVLMWSLLTALNGQRDRHRGNGLVMSPWLRTLSVFAGRVFSKYEGVSCTVLLQYICSQVQKDNFVDLFILDELIHAATGVRSEVRFSNSQLQALGGGPLLQHISLASASFDINRSFDSSRRLIESLLLNGTGAKLLLLIARNGHRQIFGEAQKPPKIVASAYDQIQNIFFQLLGILRRHVPVDQFDAMMPSFVDLVSRYHVSWPVAFIIWRSSFSEAIRQSELGIHKSIKADTVNDPEVDMDSRATMMSDQEPVVPHSNGIAAVPVDGKASSVEPGTISDHGSKEPWNSVLLPCITWMSENSPHPHLSVSFYATFWQLSLYDLFVPTHVYEDEIRRLRQATDNQLNGLELTQLFPSFQGKFPAADPNTDKPPSAPDLLRLELKTQIQWYTAVRNRLQREKSSWFSDFETAQNQDVHDALIQHCFWPRLLSTPVDAFYTFKLIFTIHNIAAPYFSTFTLFDRFFCERKLSSMIFQCSFNEVENLGRFIREVLAEFQRWHSDAETYARSAFGTKRNLTGFTTVGEDGASVTIDFEAFRRALYKWHSQLFGALKVCLLSGEYMRIRNAIFFLKGVHPVYPLINWVGKQLLEIVLNISQADTRPDIRLASTSLASDLKKVERNWMLPQAFRINDLSLSHHKPDSVSEEPTDLPEPKPIATGPEDATPTVTAPEVEDGEVDDLQIIGKASSLSSAKSTNPHLKITSAPSQEDGTNESERNGTQRRSQSSRPDHLKSTQPISDPKSGDEKPRSLNNGGEARQTVAQDQKTEPSSNRNGGTPVSSDRNGNMSAQHRSEDLSFIHPSRIQVATQSSAPPSSRPQTESTQRPERGSRHTDISQSSEPSSLRSSAPRKMTGHVPVGGSERAQDVSASKDSSSLSSFARSLESRNTSGQFGRPGGPERTRPNNTPSSTDKTYSESPASEFVVRNDSTPSQRQPRAHAEAASRRDGADDTRPPSRGQRQSFQPPPSEPSRSTEVSSQAMPVHPSRLGHIRTSASDRPVTPPSGPRSTQFRNSGFNETRSSNSGNSGLPRGVQDERSNHQRPHGPGFNQMQSHPSLPEPPRDRRDSRQMMQMPNHPGRPLDQNSKNSASSSTRPAGQPVASLAFSEPASSNPGVNSNKDNGSQGSQDRGDISTSFTATTPSQQQQQQQQQRPDIPSQPAGHRSPTSSRVSSRRPDPSARSDKRLDQPKDRDRSGRDRKDRERNPPTDADNDTDRTRSGHRQRSSRGRDRDKDRDRDRAKDKERDRDRDHREGGRDRDRESRLSPRGSSRRERDRDSDRPRERDRGLHRASDAKDSIPAKPDTASNPPSLLRHQPQRFNPSLSGANATQPRQSDAPSASSSSGNVGPASVEPPRGSGPAPSFSHRSEALPSSLPMPPPPPLGGQGLGGSQNWSSPGGRYNGGGSGRDSRKRGRPGDDHGMPSSGGSGDRRSDKRMRHIPR